MKKTLIIILILINLFAINIVFATDEVTDEKNYGVEVEYTTSEDYPGDINIDGVYVKQTDTDYLFTIRYSNGELVQVNNSGNPKVKTFFFDPSNDNIKISWFDNFDKVTESKNSIQYNVDKELFNQVGSITVVLYDIHYDNDDENISVNFSGTDVINNEIPYSYAPDLDVTIPEFNVTVNDVLIDTEHSQYPVITFKGITYFPMTSDYLSGIGLGLNFSATEGLKINMKSDITDLEQNFLGAKNTLGSIQKAQVAPFAIEVNGKEIKNTYEEFPVLLYKNITYFPMTWRFAVTEFGWKTSWSDESGFNIAIGK